LQRGFELLPQPFVTGDLLRPTLDRFVHLRTDLDLASKWQPLILAVQFFVVVTTDVAAALIRLICKLQLSFRLDKRPSESHLALDGKKH